MEFLTSFDRASQDIQLATRLLRTLEDPFTSPGPELEQSIADFWGMDPLGVTAALVVSRLPADSVGVAIRNLSVRVDADPNTATYEEVSNTGGLQIVRDPDVRRALVRYYLLARDLDEAEGNFQASWEWLVEALRIGGVAPGDLIGHPDALAYLRAVLE